MPVKHTEWRRGGGFGNTTEVLYHVGVTSQELKRWLERQGCTFEPGRGGHLMAHLGCRKAPVPMHGKSKELAKGTVEGIKKQLGLK